MQAFLKTFLKIKNKLLTAAGVFLLLCSLTHASSIFDDYMEFSNKNELQILLGTYFQNNIRVNNQQKYFDTNPIKIIFPYARLKYKRFTLTPDAAKFTIFDHLLFKMDMRLSYKGHAYKTDGMAIRHKTIYGGVGIRLLMVKLEVLRDLSGISDATIYSVAGIIPIPLGRYGLITLQGEIEIWNDKYTDYYFGVRDSEVTATRPLYKGDWSKDFNFKAMFNFFLPGHMLLTFTPGFRYYDNIINDSPTVAKRREYSLLIGLGFQF